MHVLVRKRASVGHKSIIIKTGCWGGVTLAQPRRQPGHVKSDNKTRWRGLALEQHTCYYLHAQTHRRGAEREQRREVDVAAKPILSAQKTIKNTTGIHVRSLSAARAQKHCMRVVRDALRTPVGARMTNTCARIVS